MEANGTTSIRTADASTIQTFTEREGLAEDILTDKQLLVDYDRKRQGNREALHQLRKEIKDQRVWLNTGDMFLRLPKDKVASFVEADQAHLNAEIDQVRNRLRTNVTDLEQMEGRGVGRMAGFDLKSVKQQDLLGMGDSQKGPPKLLFTS